MFERIKSKINIYVQMIITLSLIAFVSVFYYKFYNQVPQLLISVFTAVVLDILINYLRYKRKVVPYTAVVSGMIIGLVLESQTYWITALAAAVAIISKHLINVKNRHVFNPASLAILFSILVFPKLAIPSWWGSTNFLAVLIPGLLMVWRMQRFQMVGIFILVYLLLILTPNFQLNNLLTTVYNELAGPVLFFSLIMLIEPKSSPISAKGRLIFGFLVAVFTFASRNYLPTYLLLAPLAAANMLVPLINYALKPRSAAPSAQSTESS